MPTVARASGTDLPRLHLPTRNGRVSQHFASAWAYSRTVLPRRTGAFQRRPFSHDYLSRQHTRAAPGSSTEPCNALQGSKKKKKKISIEMRLDRYRPSVPLPRLSAAGRHSRWPCLAWTVRGRLGHCWNCDQLRSRDLPLISVVITTRQTRHPSRRPIWPLGGASTALGRPRSQQDVQPERTGALQHCDSHTATTKTAQLYGAPRCLSGR